MAKTLYVPVNNLSSEAKKIIVPVGGLSKYAQKAYCSVGGLSKQFWPNSVPMGISIKTHIYDASNKLAPISITTSIRNYNP